MDAESVGSNFLGKALLLDVIDETRHEVGAHLEIRRLLAVESEIVKDIAASVGNLRTRRGRDSLEFFHDDRSLISSRYRRRPVS